MRFMSWKEEVLKDLSLILGNEEESMMKEKGFSHMAMLQSTDRQA